MSHFRVPLTHPWIVSAAIKTKWTLNILLPIVYFGLWKKINLRFSRVFMFWMARMENKGKIQHLFHVCFQGSIKCEKIICCVKLGTTPSEKLANLGLRYHGRWIDSVWKSHSYADALKENPINLTFSESLIVIEYNHIFEIF